MNFIEREVHNDNDAQEDEYTVSIQFMDTTFSRLVKLYDETATRDAVLGLDYVKPFEWGKPDAELDFVCWLAQQIEEKVK